MNCKCNKPAVIRTTSKPGVNIGKQYFACPERNCDMFQWVGVDSRPISLSSDSQTRRIPFNQSHGRKTSSNDKVILMISDFNSRPEAVSVWFSAMHSCKEYQSTLTKFFLSFPQQHRQWKDKLKLWVFDFMIYESFINRLKTEHPSIDIQELPRFLVLGLRSYIRSYLDDKDVDIDADNEPKLNLHQHFLDLLFPFQLEGIKFVVKHKGRAFIGEFTVILTFVN